MTTPTPSETLAFTPGVPEVEPARRSLSSPLIWTAVVSALVSGALLALALNYLRTQAVASGVRLTESFAQIIEEQTTRTIQTADQRLELAASGIAQLAASGGLNEQSARALLKEQLKELPFVRAMWVLDPQGRIIYDSDVGNIGINLADRSYFQIYRTQPQTRFYIGIPVRSRSTGTWLISVARPMPSSNGVFAGIIVAALEPPYLDKIWRSVDLGDGGSIALFRRDGTLMMRSPFDDAAMGKTFPNGPVFRQLLPKTATGSLQYASAIDGKLRSYAYRTLSAWPEFLVMVGVSIDVILAPWQRLAALTMALWAAASLAVIALCAYLHRAGQDRARAQALALQTARRLALATEAASIGVWEWDIKTDQRYASPTYFAMLGDKPEDGWSTREQWLERIHPDDRDAVDKKTRAALAGTDLPYQYEARLRHANGIFRWYSVTASALEIDASGKPSRLIGVRMDTTDRKQAEADTRDSEARYRELFESNPHPMWVYDAGSLAFLAVNDAAISHYGYSQKEFLGMTIRDIRPAEDVSHLLRQLSREHSGVGKGGLWNHLRKDGSSILVEITTHALNFDNRAAALVLANDVTERAQAQEALRQSLERFQLASRATFNVIWDWNLTTNELVWNENFYSTFAYQPAEVENDIKSWSHRIHPEDQEAAVSGIRAAIASQREIWSHEYRFRRGDGSYAMVTDRGYISRNAHGEPMRMIGAMEDVTEHKRALLALHESEERYRLLIDLSPYAIGVHQDGVLVFANRAALGMFGATRADQLVGHPIVDLIQPDHRAATLNRIARMMQGEAGLYPTDDRGIRLDGVAFDVELSATPFTHKGRPAVQIIALDITARKEAEAALRQTTRQLRTLSRRVLEAQETERRRVARELHDELGQSLTAIKINLQSRSHFSNHSPRQLDTENIRIVDDALLQVRRLALALRPSMLDDLGLVPALRWLAEQTAVRGGLAVLIDAQVSDERLAPEVETACFRIVQEALTNVLRHAQARQVNVALQRDGDELVLSVQDDGQGFDQQAARARAQAGGSAGVLGMYERAALLGGRLHITSTPGAGTQVLLRCPWQG